MDPPTALAVAVLCILLGNPYAVRSLSFSFCGQRGGNFGLFSENIPAFGKNTSRKQKFARKCLAYLYGSVSVTMGASVLQKLPALVLR